MAESGIANPQGGQVVSGSATIGATSPSTLQVDQSTKIVIIDWSSFNIARGETTKFNQPSASSMAVNRIGGADPSQILGSLLANGRIVLINGNGIVFGPNARIDVGALLATTNDARNADIASGKATFDKAGNPNAMIVNQGSINASSGMVGLISPAVRNDGIIAAKLGSVTLGASNVFTVDFTGDGLISFPLDANVVSRAIDANGKPVEALVINNGKIVGSTVLLSARAARDLVSNVVSAGGTIAATSVRQDGGKVVLDGGDGGVLVNGTITAVGRTGGEISVNGGNVTLSHAKLDASGANGGGTIKVGGWSANSVTADSTTRLAASATTNGNGGSISVIAGSTQFAGQAEAKGGAAGGNGGLIETSGHSLDINGAQIDTSAVSGIAGNWLLDPDDYTIDATQAATIASNLASGNVTIMTTASGTGGNGDIFVNAPVSWSSANSLTLSAYRNISLAAAVTGTNGGLVLSAGGTVSDVAAVNVGTFTLQSGSWSQVLGSLPTLSAGDFRIVGGTFVRAIGGNGTSGSPYQISDVYGLQGVGSSGMLSNSYVLANDIDASGTATWNCTPNCAGFVPIGSSSPFDGTFDGQNHTISGLAITGVIGQPIRIGLFGIVGVDGTISNVGLLGGNLTARADNYAGALAGSNAGTITHSYATTTLIGTGAPVGGLVGNNSGTITDSYATGVVNGYGGVGGLVGSNTGTITRSYATGAVNVGSSFAEGDGGLVGENNGTITQSYATGAVGGHRSVGGLAGSNSGTITQSYANGTVTGVELYIGGLVGLNNGGAIAQSHATGNVDNGSGLVGKNDHGTITQSYATGNVNGQGGLVGINYFGTISQSYATGNVNGGSGLVGQNYGGTITQSYATGAAQDYSEVGGLVGQNLLGTITQSYATGSVSGALKVGGLVGNNISGTITLSYWDTQSSGQSNGVGTGSASGVTGLTTAQLSNGTLPAGFDPTAWRAQAGHYPCLLWQASCIPSITTITYVIGDSSSTYGTLATLGAVTLTSVSASDLANVVPVVSLYDSSNSAVTLSAALNAGSYTEKVTILTGSAASNYTIATTGNTDGILIVNPAPLSVAVNDASRIYGDANPAFSATITGFKLGQDSSVLSGLTLATAATPSSNVGGYAITSSGGTATNYVIASRTNGTLTINPALLTVAIKDASRTYGDANPTLTGVITGFKLSDTASVVTGLTYSTAATQVSNIGSYAITSSGGIATNYVIASRTDGTLTINPAQITVAVNDASRTYGDVNPAFSATITGFKLGQDSSVLSGLTFSTVATQSSDLGSYAITSSGGTATDYVIVTRTNGTLTITPRISWTNSVAIAALRLEEDIGCNYVIRPFCVHFNQIDIGNLTIANDDSLACILAPDLVECRSQNGRR